MKSAQIIVLGVAAAAAGGAGMIAMDLSAPPPPVVVEAAPVVAAPAIETERVLVGLQTMPVGSRITEEMLEWREWPKDAVAEGFIVESTEPAAVAELTGATVRLVSFAGEPVRREKLVGADERYMSSVLEAGKRAMAINISTANGAGGFILPNDRVDVIATMNPENGDGQSVVAQTVLTNVRVLAIDQTITESSEGGATRIGDTATLEVTAREAELLAFTRETADRISLVLRSTADLDESPSAVFNQKPHQNVTVIEGGALRVQSSKGLK